MKLQKRISMLSQQQHFEISNHGANNNVSQQSEYVTQINSNPKAQIIKSQQNISSVNNNLSDLKEKAANTATAKQQWTGVTVAGGVTLFLGLMVWLIKACLPVRSNHVYNSR